MASSFDVELGHLASGPSLETDGRVQYPQRHADSHCSVHADHDVDVLDLQGELEAGERRIEALEQEVASLRAELVALGGNSRVEQLEEELARHRQAKWVADLEIIELRTLLKDTEHQVHQARQTVEYRLGQIIVEGMQSKLGFFLINYRLLRFYLENRAQERKVSNRKHREFVADTRSATQAYDIRMVREMVASSGAAAAASWVRRRMYKPALAARLLVEVAKACRETDLPTAVQLATEALQLDQTEHRVRWVALLLAESGAVTESAELMRRAIQAGSPMSGIERRLADEIFALERLLKHPPALPPPRRRALGNPQRILMIARQSILYHWSMATLRLHAMALAIRATGREVIVLTLPGYPLSDGSRSEGPAYRVMDGVGYQTLPAVASTIHLVDQFVLQSLAPIVEFARQQGVQAIHADAGIVTGLIGLGVGRDLDIPVILDVAGDEPFAVPNGIRFDDTERFKLSRALQLELMQAADALAIRAPLPPDLVLQSAHRASVTIFDATPTSEELQGVKRQMNPLRDHPALRGRTVLGFLGEPMPGYDFYLLPEIVSRLMADKVIVPNPALLLSGVGRRIENIRDRAVARGMGDRVMVIRRPKLADLPGIYGAMDLFVAPLVDRQGLPARAPLEILMALSHGLPVITPDLPLTRTWASAGLPIVLARGSGGEALAEAICDIARDPAGQAAVSNRAHVWSLRNSARRAVSAAIDRLYQFEDGVQSAARVS